MDNKTGSFDVSYPRLAEALRAAHRGDTFDFRNRGRWQECATEVKACTADRSSLLPFVRALFEDKLPADRRLLDFSISAYQHIGPSDGTEDFLNGLWLDVFAQWTTEQRNALIQAITGTTGQDAFFALRLAKDVLTAFAIDPAILQAWIAAYGSLVANDGAQHHYWELLDGLCTNRPEEAIAVISTWQAKVLDDTERNIIARMLSRLREASGPATAGVKAGVDAIEALLMQPGSDDNRYEYLLSWAHAAGRPNLTSEQFAFMRDRIYRPNSREEDSWCYLLTRVVTEDPSSWRMVYQELDRIARPIMSRTAKHWIAHSATRALSMTVNEPTVTRIEWQQLLLKILPLTAENVGPWQDLEHYLLDALPKDPVDVQSFVLRFAERSGQQWFELLKDLHYHEMLFSELKNTAVHTSVATDLCLSPMRASRRLGLRFFERSEVNRLDAERLKSATSAQIEFLMYEATLIPLLPKDMARLHASLLARVGSIGGDLRTRFLDEVETCSLDSHGYRETMGPAAADYPGVGETITAAKEKNSKAHQAKTCAALQMEVPGQSRAAQMAFERMGREISKGAMEKSLMRVFGTPINLLYSSTWRQYSPGQGLSTPSPLSTISSEMEIPTLEFMAPEMMAARRLFANERINELEREQAKQ